VSSAAASTDTTKLIRAASRPLPVAHAISAGELRAKMCMSSGVTVVDIRSPEQVALCSIPGTRNIPDTKTRALVHFLTENSAVVLVCTDGAASKSSCTTLGFCGFKSVSYLEGGLKAWEEADLPIKRSVGTPVLKPEVAKTPRRRTLLAAALFGFAAVLMGSMLWSSGVLESVASAPPGEAHRAQAVAPSEE